MQNMNVSSIFYHILLISLIFFQKMPKHTEKQKRRRKDLDPDPYAEFDRCDLIQEIKTIFTFVGVEKFTYKEVYNMLETKFRVDLNSDGYKALIRGAV